MNILPRFQSTRPLRGATSTISSGDSLQLFQSTRPLRGATNQGLGSIYAGNISIHAPLAGRDHAFFDLFQIFPRFQSTRPLRGATSQTRLMGLTILDFNPRAPCGARLERCLKQWALKTFQSTRPLRGATSLGRSGQWHRRISIHAPLAGRDRQAEEHGKDLAISIHAPLAGRDSCARSTPGRIAHFNPRAPCGARPMSIVFFRSMIYFNPRAPCGARLFLA